MGQHIGLTQMNGSYLFFFSSCIFVELTAKSVYKETQRIEIFYNQSTTARYVAPFLCNLSLSLPSSPPFFLSSLCVCFYVYGGEGIERRKREGDREVEADTFFCIFFFYKYALYLMFQGKTSPSQINYTHLCGSQ